MGSAGGTNKRMDIKEGRRLVPPIYPLETARTHSFSQLPATDRGRSDVMGQYVRQCGDRSDFVVQFCNGSCSKPLPLILSS